MAAQPVPHPSTDKKRVKVYELRNNDWFDRGTGFCTAALQIVEDGQREHRVIVESEDQPERILLETRISKGDSFHKQQETLIVWTEPSNGVDMALSFQEAEGCSLIWRFINQIQTPFRDESLSDDLAMDMPNPISLPPISLKNLPEIESQLRMMSGTGGGRDALTKYVLSEDMVGKLHPLVSDAEDLESLPDLHRLCNIMKIIILLNDTSIIEHAVSDECVIGVVGALEYDPDFPSHKANHRQWLKDASRYKEVVPIEDPQILKKVHQTYRLQYLKDVVLARILDDNTFSVLNSLIFFNQVDIVQHLQANGAFLMELFDIFKYPGQDPKRKKEAVLFIQQCCSIAKNLQPPARQTLYNNFIVHGLLHVINFGLRHTDVAVRVGATDVMVSMIDHDPQMIRQTIYRQINEKQTPLTDSLIDLLLVEVDLGVKSQISDALKVILDQGPPPQDPAFAKVNGEFAARAQARMPTADPQQERFLDLFYAESAAKLFQPLLALKDRPNMEFTVQHASMFTYLIEILCFFIRQHHYRARTFVVQNEMVQRIAQLLGSSEKFLKLVAIRFLRQLVGIPDGIYLGQITDKEPSALNSILDLLLALMPRDNLVTSACLEFYEHVKKESVKPVIKHVVEGYREKLEKLAYMPTFQAILDRYDHTQGFTVNLDFMEPEDDVMRRRATINPRTGALMEHLTMDQAEEEYWANSDDEDDLQGKADSQSTSSNGSAMSTKLVDYASDEDSEENMDGVDLGSDERVADGSGDEETPKMDLGPGQQPPERLSEKRRREEEDEDELGKLISHKRRNSTSASANASATSGFLKKKKAIANARDAGGGGPKKIAISLSPAIKAGSGSPSLGGDES